MESRYDRLLTYHLVQGRIIDATQHEVPNLKIFAMHGKVKHYDEKHKLSKYYGYKDIVAATEGKTNGLTDADESPAAPPMPVHGGEL